MELYKTRGCNKNDIELKKYNLGVAISLGNKWFTSENIIELITWALPHTREYVVVYVADSIHGINLSVRNKLSDKHAEEVAIRYGEDLMQKIKEKVKVTFNKEEQSKIVYAKWNDIADAKYKEKVKYLYTLYNSNSEFRNYIENFIKEWISKEKRAFTENQINTFGKYIIEEIPELMIQVPASGIMFEAYIYPHESKLTQFVEKLQNGEIFPEIKENILDDKPKIFLEVR